VIAAAFLGVLAWSLLIRDLQAAIRFEVRLAEYKPAPGLREAKVSGSHLLVYLHNEVIVSNSDLAGARVFQDKDPWNYGINIELNAAGAEKMHAATVNHIGKPLAFLLDGQVIMAPEVHTPIGASAEITGKLTRAEAERIVRGIEIQ
jgi:preprotein translocase subunit SecD